MTGSFAIYRLPYSDKCTMIRQTSGEPLRLDSCTGLTYVEGFVFAPFNISAESPAYVLKPDVIENTQLSDTEDFIKASYVHCNDVEERQSYGADFGMFHNCLSRGEFQKIVLARRHNMRCDTYISPEVLFRRACRMYPRMFVALVSTPFTGTWLMATPEILLEGRDRQWQTMALAGTMALEGELLSFDTPVGKRTDNVEVEWNKKNICEQRLVAQYIAECLGRYSDEVVESGPYTVRAGNVVHLRSDFSFVLGTGKNIGDLINDLHPTPAVCGLPKKNTFDFIVNNEHCGRDFYSGFAGPLFKGSQSHLFVSLRCMRIERTEYSLYAGGGLLADSCEQQEWDETEEKLKTMKEVLNVK